MKNNLVLLLALFHFGAFGQISEYNFKRDLTGIADDWHNVELPNDIFEKVSPNLNDIRFYGITAEGDTVEAPYIIRTKKDQVTVDEVPFTLINSVKKDKGYYYTLKLDGDEIINEISLNFSLSNFDWKIQLEGSQDQKEWFSIEDSYRILSIQNDRMNYAHTRLSFPNANFKFYRIFIPTDVDPGFVSATVTHTSFVAGKKRDFNIISQNISEDKANNETIIELKLETSVPINALNIGASDEFDFYRSIAISYLTDSTKTEKGYIRNYSEITRGTFSSLENNVFYCSNITTNNLKIVIKNNDNQALNISTISVNGYVHELVARFTETAAYSLVYGNSSAKQPNYDIDHFTNSIPEVLVPLTMGDEIAVLKTENETSTGSMFENPIWLWGIMGLVILILGYFTFKMLGAEKGKSEN